MTDLLLIIISVLLIALLVSFRKLFKMLDAWRYEWWQRTPRQTSNAEIMADIYSNENNKQSPLTRESAEEYRKIHHPDQL